MRSVRIVEQARTVGDHRLRPIGEPIDDAHDLTGLELRPCPRVGKTGDHRHARARLDLQRAIERPLSVLDRVDGRTHVGLEREPKSLRDRRRDIVGIEQREFVVARETTRELDRDLGAAAAGRTADGDERTDTDRNLRRRD